MPAVGGTACGSVCDKPFLWCSKISRIAASRRQMYGVPCVPTPKSLSSFRHHTTIITALIFLTFQASLGTDRTILFVQVIADLTL